MPMVPDARGAIYVRGHLYAIVDEPALNGEVLPHLYDRRGDCIGHLAVLPSGPTVIVGAPLSWTFDDIDSAITQIEAQS